MLQSPSLQSLSEENNEQAVRMRLAHNQYSPPDVPIVEEWLRLKEESRRDAREEETLRIAKSANRLALWANAIAAIAAITAIVAIVIAK